MRILSVFGLLVANLLAVVSMAQIQTGETPPSFSARAEKTTPINYTFNLTDPNTESLEQEDVVTDQLKDFAWRFGTPINVSYDLSNAGEWFHDDDNGTSTWKLKISFLQAKTINLNFDNFSLSNNAKLFIYNDSHTDVLGALTAKNNKHDGLFSIRPMNGNSITLELVTPQNEFEVNKISINEVIYGYRSIGDKVQKVFQGSGNCNLNINCSEGDDWQDVKRSVALVTTASNTRFCTATLINNVRQDSTPYILTAAHCGLRNNSIFIFGYESTFCNPNADGNLSNSISGSSRKAITVNFGSDFELRQLSSRPPANYNVYYAGWNNQNVASTKSIGIHHPSGDVKKISIDYDILTNSGYYSTGVTHWQVSNWEKGTTEGGSSGSALFDANQMIIGQLHGGDAACGNNSQDYYGKFSRSWDFSSDTLRQLKHWLDPDNTGATTLTGLDPTPSAFSFDLATLEVDGILAFECTQSVSPTIRIKNLGNITVDSFFVDIELNNNLFQTLKYSNALPRMGIAVINPTALSPVNGINVIKITTRLIGAQDQDLSNNTDSVLFNINRNSNEFFNVTVKTDDYGSETSWQLEDLANNLILHSSPGYPDVNGGQVYRDTLCAYSGCFRFSIFDSQSDGFNDPSGNFGNGYLLITNPNGDTLFYEDNFRTALSSDTFCLQLSTSIQNQIIQNKSISVFPNPIETGEILNISGEKAQLTLRNAQGQLLVKKVGSQINIPHTVSSGVYFLEIRELNTNKILDIKKVLIK